MSSVQSPEGIFAEGLPGIGFRLPQFVILERLSSGYKAIRQNPAQVKTALLRQGKRFVEDQAYPLIARREIAIFTGYPLEESQIPGIGITLQQTSEDAGMQEIGERGRFQVGKSIVSVYGTFMQTGVQVAHYGQSQVEADIMGQLTVMILLARRDKLETEDGLMQQRVMLADVNPNPNMKRENAFMRMVLYNCVHEDTWAITRSPLVAETEVLLQDILDGPEY